MEEIASNISTPAPDAVGDKLKLIEDRLDITPQGLEFCFERKEFLKESFDVDKFIVERKKRLALESLKDDLMAYLRILKSSLVELINQDYADFVNLSTNLVGLDRAITSIQTPMEAFQASIEDVNNDIAATVRDIEGTLAKRQAIRNRKVLVQNARSLACCIDRLEAWLGIGSQLATSDRPTLSDGAAEDEEEGRVLERVGTEYTKLQYFARKCDQQEKLLRHVRPRMSKVADRLHMRLDSYFLAALPSPEEVAAAAPAARSGGDCPSPAWATPARGHRLRTALRVFVNTDRSGEAMLLLRRHLVEPLLDTIELEPRLTPEGLEKLFDAILLLLPAVILPLRRLMAGGSSGGSSGGPLADLDLVTSALWPAVVERLTDRLPHLFSAGQADAFHANYTASMTMTAAFEAAATSPDFRTHPVTVQFLAKWTLPVYMQLRFQEIASEVEEAAKSPEAEAETEAEESDLRLRVSQVVLKLLRRCWDPSVFLAPLAHRFWKLSLQLLARFATSVRASCSADVSMGAQLLLLLDSFALVEQSRAVLRDVIEPRLAEVGCDSGRLEAAFRPAFEEGLTGVGAAAAAVERRLAERIEAECATHLRLVQDVPRQYRKTNRESPSKPAAYANNLLRPLSSFLELHANPLQREPHGPAVTKRLAISCTENIGRRYQESLAEVLESVRKMEDSLRLLRKARGQPATAGGAGGSGVSDDAKIRQQLLLDARHIQTVARGLLPAESDLPPVLLEMEALAEQELGQ